MSKKGFTLIELLVVIAIIGILASIVLVSFPGATKKAKDSRVISGISQVRTEWTSFYANQGTYAAFAMSPSLSTEITNNCYVASGTCTFGTNWNLQKLNTGAADVCVYAPLNEKDGTTWYCADGSGLAGKTPVGSPPTATCTAALFTCPVGTTL